MNHRLLANRMRVWTPRTGLSRSGATPSGSTRTRSTWLGGRLLRGQPAGGFTLIEIMVATAITLLLMGSVAAMFGFVSTSVTDSRAMAEAGERLRNVRNLLQHDLQGITAHGTPPLNPDQSAGYLEVMEGPGGVIWKPGLYYMGGNYTQQTNPTSWDDCDDVLMFTSRSNDEPFVGRFYDNGGHWNVLSSQTAEVAWFVRGTTLYRRTLLVLPNHNMDLLGSWAAPYYYSDISVHQEGGSLEPKIRSNGVVASPKLYANSLSDLTKREYRYAHQPLAWPYDARFWNWPSLATGTGTATLSADTLSPYCYEIPNVLGLPTLQECSGTSTASTSAAFMWPFPLYGPDPPAYVRPSTQYASTLFGYYILPMNCKLSQKNPNPAYYPYRLQICPVNSTGLTSTDPIYVTTTDNALNRWQQTNSGAGQFASHYSMNPPRFDDIVLTGVVGFDVKIWDPGAPVFQTTGTVGGQNVPLSVTPGDPWYHWALSSFDGNASPANTTATLGSVGAYVDLNYMTAGFTGTSGKTTNYFTTYVNALNNYENNALVKVTTAVPGISTYPGFIIPRPRFANEGDPSIYTAYSLGGPSYAYMGCPTIMRGIPTATTIPTGYMGNIASVFDTWSTHYESDGVDQDQDGVIDEGTDGIDNPWVGYPWTNVLVPPRTPLYIGGVDDPSELEAPPPYASACKGLQIRIRIIEPGSRQIREVTVVQEILEE